MKLTYYQMKKKKKEYGKLINTNFNELKSYLA